MAKNKSLQWLKCSEENLKKHMIEWLSLYPIQNSILFLEGEMGVGKSTFVRALLSVIAPAVKSEGSPTFSLVQEYSTDLGQPLYHIDLYRLKNESELEDSGILVQIESLDSIACVEWGSLLESSFAYWLDSKRQRPKSVWVIHIDGGDSDRNYQLTQY